MKILQINFNKNNISTNTLIYINSKQLLKKKHKTIPK